MFNTYVFIHVVSGSETVRTCSADKITLPDDNNLFWTICHILVNVLFTHINSTFKYEFALVESDHVLNTARPLYNRSCWNESFINIPPNCHILG